MGSEQSTPELTTRDVLLQLDRRTELIEGDLRSLDTKVDTLAQQTAAGFAELRQEMSARFEEQRLEMKSDLSEARQETKSDMAQFRLEMKSDLDQHRQETKSDIAQFRQEMKADLNEQRRESGARFNWLVGLVLATWLSTMGTVLFKG